MRKNLISRLKNGLYAGLAAGALLGSYVGCKDNPIEPSPKISQAATLENFVDINYRATFENVNSATRKSFYNGNGMATETITISPYQQILTNRTKGDYMFVLEADGVKPDTTKPLLNVPDYNSTADFNGLETQLYSNESITLDLPVPRDKNPEDNPVQYTKTWSPDGKTIPTLQGNQLTIESKDLLGNYEVALEIRNNTEGLDTLTLRGAVIPDQIAYWNNPGGNEDIYLINQDGTGLERLTTDPSQDFQPAWSPDGEYLAWATNRDSLVSIYVMKRDKTGCLRKLTPPINTDFFSPSWSPDGTQIAFAFIDRSLGTNGIARMNSDGSGLITKLFSSPGTGVVPGGLQWYGDGRIFYHDVIENNFEIFSINPDGSKTRITNPYNEFTPNLSPVGDRITFVSDQFEDLDMFGRNLDIFLMNPDRTDVQIVTKNPDIEVDPIWFPDGSKILFSRWNWNTLFFEMYSINPDGTGEKPLSINGRYAAWRPR